MNKAMEKTRVSHVVTWWKNIFPACIKKANLKGDNGNDYIEVHIFVASRVNMSGSTQASSFVVLGQPAEGSAIIDPEAQGLSSER